MIEGGTRQTDRVEGSDSSLDALRSSGARQAELTGAEIDVVGAWALHVQHPMGALYTENFDPERDACNAVEGIAQTVRREHPDVTVHTHVIEGHSAPTLIEASKDAGLLVVGSRGHGAFVGMLLGSVSEHCVSHAQCPVVVVRHQRPPS